MSLHKIKVTSSAPISGLLVTSENRDADGQYFVRTPGIFTFKEGEEVSLSAPAKTYLTLQSPINFGTRSQEAKFRLWQIDGVDSAANPVIKFNVVKLRSLTAVYALEELPWEPSSGELEVMSAQLKFAPTKTSLFPEAGIIILWDEQPVRIFDQLIFKTEEVARAHVQRFFLSYFKDWKRMVGSARASSWLGDEPMEGNASLFMVYWMKRHLRFVPFAEYNKALNDSKRKT